MSEVQVYFVGMVMWFLTGPGPFALMPELSTDPNAHLASIMAAPSAFVGGVCPPGFSTMTDGNCTYALNGKGAPGGVRISVLTNTPSAGFPPDAFCAIPPLQRSALFELKPAFTPPHGVGNAAWMAAVGGTPSSGILPCQQTSTGNCPRFVRWTVPVTQPARAVLSLDNLRSGAPLLVQLANDAVVVISNSPPDDAAHAGHAKLTRETTLDTEDWCFYFRMIMLQGGIEPDCPGAPPIPPPCPNSVPPPGFYPLKVRFQTIACSNSQYP